jgi:hemerythrin
LPNEPIKQTEKCSIGVVMSKLCWDDKLSVNVKEIDDQHKELIRMINRLGEAISDGSWSKKMVLLTDVLLDMTDYLQYHFSFEEKYMIDLNYPDYQEHNQEHQSFVQEVTNFTEDFQSGKKGLTKDVLDFLWDWYFNHIMNVDQKMGEFIAARMKT